MKLSVEIYDNIPRFNCDECYKCNSKIGVSLCKYKHRGCCFYYPKFNLVDLQRMVKDPEGKPVINKILNNKRAKIFNYYIQEVGYFDKEGYNNYLKSSNFKFDKSEPLDKTLYFKSCPFVVDGKGCSIPSKFRTPVCNFFLCTEIKNTANYNNLIHSYELAAREYYHYYEWENENLIELFEEKGLTLKNNLKESLEFLKSLKIYYCEFPKLKDFDSNDINSNFPIAK